MTASSATTSLTTASAIAASATSSAASASATASSATVVAASASATASSATSSAAGASCVTGEQRVRDGLLGHHLGDDGLVHGLVGDDLGDLGLGDGLFGHELGRDGLDHGLFGHELGRGCIDDRVVGDGRGLVGALGRLVRERLGQLVLQRRARLVDARAQVFARRGRGRLVPHRERPRGLFGDGLLDDDHFVDDRLGRRPRCFFDHGRLGHRGGRAAPLGDGLRLRVLVRCGAQKLAAGAADQLLTQLTPALRRDQQGDARPDREPEQKPHHLHGCLLDRCRASRTGARSRRRVRRKKRARALQCTALYTLGPGAVLPGAERFRRAAGPRRCRPRAR